MTNIVDQSDRTLTVAPLPNHVLKVQIVRWNGDALDERLSVYLSPLEVQKLIDECQVYLRQISDSAED